MPDSRPAERPSLADPVLGDAASAAALARLGEAASGGLGAAVAAIARGDFAAAAQVSEAATRSEPANGLAWYLLAIAREKLGQLFPSLEAYEQALARLPNPADVANDLGRLAWRLGMPEVAAPLFAHHLAARPGARDATVNLAGALRDQHRYAEAVEVLKPAAQAAPQDPVLWNALGEVLSQQGDPATARTFFDEALRLDPGFTAARLNRGGARLDLGDAAGAVQDSEAALAEAGSDADRAAIGYSHALNLLCGGRVGEGWAAYEARLSPDFAGSPRFLIDAPAWRPGDPLAGRSLLVVGEQGLGDEVMFAGVLPEVVAALGPEGRLTLAVEPRLVELFQRSFPRAAVGAHSTDKTEARPLRGAPFLGAAAPIDAWAPMGTLLKTFRGGLEAFPQRPAYLAPDPERVAHWRAWLASLPPGPKVGIVWKSLKLGAERRRAFAPFRAWTPVLETPGAVFVSLQYGDASAEIAEAARAGVLIRTPPGLDLKDDLEGVAALTAALDLVIGFANATTQIAGAVGAPLWLLTPPGSWTCLGTERYPWHPQARVFHAPGFGWEGAMAAVASALGEGPKAS
jgi:tetratricopeptide (TPR) repeat protein